MPAARYWRLVGCAPYDAFANLSVSELGLFDGTTRRGSAPSCTYAPLSGTVSALGDEIAGAVATFSSTDLAKSNFGFYWDLGSALNVDSLVVGTPVSTTNHLAKCTLEASDDNIYWRAVSVVNGLNFPAANTLVVVSKFKIITPDAVCKFDGANGAKVVDTLVGSIAPFTFGTNVALSTAQKYDGSASMFFPGEQTLITSTFSAGTAFTGRFASTRFTAAAWIYPTALGGFVAGSFNSQGGTNHEGWFIKTESSGSLTGMIFIVGFSTFQVNAPTGLLSLNTWQHVAIEREENILRIYINGQVVASRSDLPVAPIGSSLSRNLGIGSLNSNVNNTPFTGYIDDLMLTGSAAVYGGFSFTPDAWVFQTGETTAEYEARPAASLHTKNLDIKLFTPQNVNTTLRETPQSESRIDMIFGGRGVIAGTVKEKSLPENTPLFRKVRLIDERSGYVVAETWSDAATGNYSFANIDRSRKYTVVSYDHTGFYRAVIADNLTPDLMS